MRTIAQVGSVVGFYAKSQHLRQIGAGEVAAAVQLVRVAPRAIAVED
jgi:hypothetical protein